MTAITSELLMRYVDGEISPTERHSIEEHLLADSKARALVASFQHQQTLLPVAFRGADSEPGPSDFDRFGQAIDKAFERRRRDWRHTELRRWALPLAASILITLVGGLLFAFYAEQRIQSETARILAERAAEDAQTHQLALQTRIEALERIVSGKSLSWTYDITGATGTITPLRTYPGPDGQWCREYQETIQSAMHARQNFSIACRTPTGEWRGHGMGTGPRGL